MRAGSSARLDEAEAASLRGHAVRSLASAVGSPYQEVWSEAMKILALTRPQGAVPVLDALAEGNPEVALRARVARAAWGGPEAQEVLERALQNPSHRLRAAACGIMGSLGDASSAEELSRCLADPSGAVRVSAAWALGAIGGSEAATALERSAAAEDVPTRTAARRALAALRARKSNGPSRSRRGGAGEGRERTSTVGLALEQVLAGADGRLFCVICAPGGERRLVARGEETDAGYRVEAIVPDGRGGGRVFLSRDGGRETLQLTLKR